MARQDGRLLVYSIETGKQIASHPVSQEKGQLVSDPAHKPLRSADVPQKERQITDRVGDSETVSLFLADLAADKPRYYRKTLQLIIRSMDDYMPGTLRQAMLTCLDRRVYNAKVLMEVAESLRKRNGEPPRAVKAPSGNASNNILASQRLRSPVPYYNGTGELTILRLHLRARQLRQFPVSLRPEALLFHECLS